MWAILDKNDNKTVVGVLPPDADSNYYKKIKKEHTLILMTQETGLGYIPGYYKNGKFYKGLEK